MRRRAAAVRWLPGATAGTEAQGAGRHLTPAGACLWMAGALALAAGAAASAAWQGVPAGEPGLAWPAWGLVPLAAGLAIAPLFRTGPTRRRRDTGLERPRRFDPTLDASGVEVWDFSAETGEPGLGRRGHDGGWRDRVHPDDAARVERELREAIATGRFDSGFRLLLAGGGVRHVRAAGGRHEAEHGAARLVGVIWDVTAEVARAADLDTRRREAEADALAKSEFLATLSHEMRTPMNGVLGMLDLVLRAEAAPGQRERIVVARNSARHLLSILNDVHDLSKLQASRIALEPTDVDVHRLARDVAALLATGARDRDVDVSVRITPTVPAWLVCDATRLRQVMLNLVGNAVKFTEVGGVELRLDYVGDGQLEVAVTDTGIGIPAEALENLFERFAQVDDPLATRRREGSGLGLAISRELVELMGGSIAVESMPGLGSTFRFRIPAPPAIGRGADEPAGAGVPVATAARPGRILVAEDNAANRQILAAYLGMGGHETRIVTNGVEALTALHCGSYDLVILDVQMPVMDGITATRRIRALPGPEAAVPIIALTAGVMAGDREACLAAGMTDYVAKPVSVEALLGAVARCLDYSPVSSTGAQPSPGSKLSMTPATARVSSPRSAS